MLANMTVHGNYFSYTFLKPPLGCRSPKVSKEPQNKVNKASFADQQSLLLFYVALLDIYIYI